MSKKPTGHEPSAEALLQQTFARNLRAARKRKRMTQAKAAAAIGVSDPVWGRYERAVIWPSIETLRDMCKVLEVSADALLGLGQEETPALLSSSPDDPPIVRRILKRLQGAHEDTRRIIAMVLARLDRNGRL